MKTFPMPNQVSRHEYLSYA